MGELVAITLLCLEVLIAWTLARCYPRPAPPTVELPPDSPSTDSIASADCHDAWVVDTDEDLERLFPTPAHAAATMPDR